ncbi:MAG: dihydrofolate reductase [Ideonella sp.]|nr:dihydrofolate reductase [Ideonella sp.]MCC7459132.1 dihydrofolate reductase [Nitrospira sp.]
MSDHPYELVLIAAVARNGVIGRDGALPWHLAADLQRFRELTRQCPVVMGRRTWDSLPTRYRPLPGRSNIVVTRRAGWSAEGAQAAASLAAALALAQLHLGSTRQVFVIGGAQLYEQALPLADVLELTELHADVQGDARFPPWSRSAFVETARIAHAADAAGSPAFDFVTYRRRDSNT